MTTKLKVFLGVTLVSLVLDQITKILVYTNLSIDRSDEIQIIPGLLSFIHAQNPNAAFGLGASLPQPYRLLVFGVFTLIAVGMMVQMFMELPAKDRFHSTTLGLILSGAVGNAIDRVHKQSVTDFIRVYTDDPELKTWCIQNFGMSEWPTFNIADAAIVVGVALYLVGYLFIKDEAGALPPETSGRDPVGQVLTDKPS